jgi:hypothetical protein
MLLFVDAVSRRFHHATFNAALIKVLSLATGIKKLNILVSEDHKHALLECGMSDALNVHALKQTIPVKNFSYVRNPFLIISVSWYILKYARHIKAKLVIVGDAHPLLIACIRYLAPIVAPGIKFHMLFHGSLVSLPKWISRNPIIRLFDWPVLLKWQMPSFIRFLALEHYIKDAITQLAPHASKQWDVFEHPVLGRQMSTTLSPPLPKKKIWNIGFIGAARVDKGFPQFLEIARRFQNNESIKFHAIGLLDSSAVQDCTVLTTKPSLQPLDEKAYATHVEKLDLIIAIFDPEKYKFISSGTYLDAVSFGKPIIAIGYLGTKNSGLMKFESVSHLSPEDQAVALIQKLIDDDSNVFYNKLLEEVVLEGQCRANDLLAAQYKAIVLEHFSIHI